MIRAILFPLFLLLAADLSMAQAGGTTSDVGKSGVKEGCYKSGQGRVNLDAKGKTTGDVDVTVTDEDGKSDTGLGTQAGDGGVWESEEMTVGGEKYKVDRGKLKRQKSDGTWETLTKTADKDCHKGGTHNPGGGNGTIGTLPGTGGEIFVYSPEWLEVRPADEMIPCLA